MVKMNSAATMEGEATGAAHSYDAERAVRLLQVLGSLRQPGSDVRRRRTPARPIDAHDTHAAAPHRARVAGPAGGRSVERRLGDRRPRRVAFGRGRAAVA